MGIIEILRIRYLGIYKIMCVNNAIIGLIG